MATHAEQHFVPRFLLERWHTGDDAKLTSFRWADDSIVSHRYKAKSVAKERHLYSMSRSSPTPDVQIEKAFWGPHVDDPAAVVHAKMLAQGVSSLTAEEKKDWSPFVVSLMIRTPRMVRHIRERGRSVLQAGLDENPDEYLAARGQAPEASLREWIEKHAPDVLDDLGVMTLPELAFSERLNLTLLNVTWGIRAIGSARYNLLISDSPLIVAGTLESSFLVALPISPRHLFFAYNNERTFDKLRQLSHDLFVRETNLSTVAAAETYVYATDATQRSFVQKYLPKPAPPPATSPPAAPPRSPAPPP